MTTPNQPLPDSVQTAIGTGAYEIGTSGGGTNYGQDVDETVVTNLFRIPNPTEDNVTDVFTQALAMLPANSMAAFEPIIPDFDPEDTQENWIQQLMDSLFPKTTPTTVQEDQQEFWDSLWNGFLQAIGLSGATPADIGAAAVDVSDTANTALYNTETMPGFFNAPRVLPVWMGSLSDEVAFNRSAVDGTTTPALGTLVLIPVKVTQDRVIDAIKVGMTGSSMTNLKIALYDCDEATGNLTKVLDLGDRKTELNLSFQQQTFQLVEPVGVQASELYYVGVLQVGGVASPIHRSSVTTTFSDGFFPKFLGNSWTTTGITLLPTSIPVAEVAGGTRYWGALGTVAAPVVPPGLRYTDSFNRADNSSSMGPAWTNRAGVGGIYANTPTAQFFSAFHATYNNRLSSPSQRVGFSIKNAPLGDGSVGHTVGVTLRGNGLGPHVRMSINITAALSSNNTLLQIITNTGYGGSGTTRVSINLGAGTAPSIGNWTFEANGNQYFVYKNGEFWVGWVDSGGVFPVAANCTEVGIYNGGYLQRTQDDWFAEDL